MIYSVADNKLFPWIGDCFILLNVSRTDQAYFHNAKISYRTKSDECGRIKMHGKN
jgi:hypothetical protein